MRQENFWLEAGTKGRRKVISGGTITVRCSADGLWNRIRIYARETGVIPDRQWRR